MKEKEEQKMSDTPEEEHRMTDTPESDAVMWHDNHVGFEVVDVDFARKLERERDEAMEALDCLLSVIGLTPIAGNKQALQEAFDLGLAVLKKNEGRE